MSTSIQILLVIPSTLLLIGLVMLIVTMTVNSKDYKYYRVTHYAIKNCNYVMVRNSYNQQTYHRPQEINPYTNDAIIFFLNSHGEVDSIKLLSRPSENHYIHDKGGSDLYSRYWFRKILKVRDKYNHQLWMTTRSDEMVEDITGNNFYVSGTKSSFKFLRG